jgi:hypothetical protein
VALLALIGEVTARALAHRSAALRHQVWVAVGVVALLLPVISLLPPLPYHRLGWVDTIGGGHSATLRTVALLWLIGSLALGVRLWHDLVALGVIARRAHDLLDPEWQDALRRAAALARVSVPIRLLRAGDELVPMTFGC